MQTSSYTPFFGLEKSLRRTLRLLKRTLRRSSRESARERKVVTTVVHLSEVANVVESRAGKGKAAEIVLSILTSDNIRVLDVSTADYIRSALIAEEKNLGINDALAYIKMQELGIDEIYTFDRDFERLEVKVVRE